MGINQFVYQSGPNPQDTAYGSFGAGLSFSVGVVTATGGGGAGLFSGFAGVNLGGQRLVRLNDAGLVVYADKDSAIGEVDRLLGVTQGAAMMGDVATVQLFGPMEELSWDWDLNERLYLGNTGLITQTVPSSGSLVCIGKPLTPTQILIALNEALVLA